MKHSLATGGGLRHTFAGDIPTATILSYPARRQDKGATQVTKVSKAGTTAKPAEQRL